MIDALKPQTRAWPYVIIFIGLVVGSSGPILIRLAQSEHMPSLAIVAGRQIISMVILTPLILSRYRHELRLLSLRNLIFAGIAGTLMAVRFFILFEAFNNTSVLITGVFNGSGPLWVGLTEAIFLKAVFNRNTWVGVLLALVGGIVIALAGFDGGTSMGNNAVLGGAYALLSAFLSAFYLVLGRVARGQVSFWPYLWLVFAFAAVTSLIGALLTGTSLTGYSTNAYIWLFLLTLTAQLVAHGAVNYALAYVPATFISISSQLTTVLSAFAAFLVFGETPGLMQVIGSAIIIAGVTVATLGRAK